MNRDTALTPTEALAGTPSPDAKTVPPEITLTDLAHTIGVLAERIPPRPSALPRVYSRFATLTDSTAVLVEFPSPIDSATITVPEAGVIIAISWAGPTDDQAGADVCVLTDGRPIDFDVPHVPRLWLYTITGTPTYDANVIGRTFDLD